MHPNPSDLALYAGKDMNVFARLRLRYHLRRCARCHRQVEELRGMREWLREQDDELPAGLDWDVLSREMRANIRLGLAAGQCVAAPIERPVRLPWRTPAVVMPVLLLVVAGWLLLSLQPPLRPIAAPELRAARGNPAVLEAGTDGIGFEQDGRGFALLRPKDVNVVYTVRGPGAVRARYVDSDTGQVTISHVYAE